MRSRQNIPIPDEIYRIEHYTNGEPPLVEYDFFVMEYEVGSDCVEKIRAVMALVAPFNEGNWLSEAEWRQILPKWFLDTFIDHKSWLLASWLIRMREREWKWWSVAKNETQFTVYVTTDGVFGALKVLIEAAGGQIIYEF